MSLLKLYRPWLLAAAALLAATLLTGCESALAKRQPIKQETADRWNATVLTNDRSNEFEMNQLWLAFVRPVKADGCGWAIGG